MDPYQYQQQAQLHLQQQYGQQAQYVQYAYFQPGQYGAAYGIQPQTQAALATYQPGVVQQGQIDPNQAYGQALVGQNTQAVFVGATGQSHQQPGVGVQGVLSQPPAPPDASAATSGVAVATGAVTLQSIEEAKAKYQKEYEQWKEQYTQWQAQHANHPDQKQFQEYQKQMQTWHEQQQQLLQAQAAALGQSQGGASTAPVAQGGAVGLPANEQYQGNVTQQGVSMQQQYQWQQQPYQQQTQQWQQQTSYQQQQQQQHHQQQPNHTQHRESQQNHQGFQTGLHRQQQQPEFKNQGQNSSSQPNQPWKQGQNSSSQPNQPWKQGQSSSSQPNQPWKQDQNSSSQPNQTWKQDQDPNSQPNQPWKQGQNSSSQPNQPWKQGQNSSPQPNKPWKQDQNSSSQPNQPWQQDQNSSSRPNQPWKQGQNSSSQPNQPWKQGQNSSSQPNQPWKQGQNSSSQPNQPWNQGQSYQSQNLQNYQRDDQSHHQEQENQSHNYKNQGFQSQQNNQQVGNKPWLQGAGSGGPRNSMDRQSGVQNIAYENQHQNQNQPSWMQNKSQQGFQGSSRKPPGLMDNQQQNQTGSKPAWLQGKDLNATMQRDDTARGQVQYNQNNQQKNVPRWMHNQNNQGNLQNTKTQWNHGQGDMGNQSTTFQSESRPNFAESYAKRIENAAQSKPQNEKPKWLQGKSEPTPTWLRDKESIDKMMDNDQNKSQSVENKPKELPKWLQSQKNQAPNSSSETKDSKWPQAPSIPDNTQTNEPNKPKWLQSGQSTDAISQDSKASEEQVKNDPKPLPKWLQQQTALASTVSSTATTGISSTAAPSTTLSSATEASSKKLDPKKELEFLHQQSVQLMKLAELEKKAKEANANAAKTEPAPGSASVPTSETGFAKFAPPPLPARPPTPPLKKVPCKFFPTCRYGKECRFKHPPCEAGNECEQTDCILDHSGPPLKPREEREKEQYEHTRETARSDYPTDRYPDDGRYTREEWERQEEDWRQRWDEWDRSTGERGPPPPYWDEHGRPPKDEWDRGYPPRDEWYQRPPDDREPYGRYDDYYRSERKAWPPRDEWEDERYRERRPYSPRAERERYDWPPYDRERSPGRERRSRSPYGREYRDRSPLRRPPAEYDRHGRPLPPPPDDYWRREAWERERRKSPPPLDWERGGQSYDRELDTPNDRVVEDYNHGRSRYPPSEWGPDADSHYDRRHDDRWDRHDPYVPRDEPHYPREHAEDSRTQQRNVQVVPVETILDCPGRDIRPDRIVIILRGPPGSGKTHVAKLIKDKEVSSGAHAPRILSLDDYFLTEVEKTEKDPETGKRIKKKVTEYVYEPEMEEVYMASLFKAFTKTLDDGFFPMVLMDATNDKVSHFEKYWSLAKQKGFEVYIVEISADAHACAKRNSHHRSFEEINKMVEEWEESPTYMLRLDVRPLLQDAIIREVEMEAADEASTSKDESKEKKEENKEEEEEEEPAIVLPKKSKWEESNLSAEQQLNKLDGIRPLRKRAREESPLLVPDDDDDPYDEKEDDMRIGKKRVRWADQEEKKQMEHRRRIGFCIGTDWSLLTDPNARIPEH
ncbi:YLP motif-containing protein 1-like [Nematostella vectensis]|uniref:YLP motif-containing protein 1-like n=1 Tax=Nematostella vectensis TaxID=45351 RepID=UPI0020774CF0|nr:YLP motif-containing protein 1-like [Nematostella vectensis]XP_048579476.1 YLP motif-containing protein 1-like [Nematostella vectensis]